MSGVLSGVSMNDRPPARVLVVSQYFWPEEFRINDLVEQLVLRGHEVVVLTGLPNYPAGRVFEDYRADPTVYETYRGAKVVRVPLVPRGRGNALRLVLNYLSFAVSGSVVGWLKLRSHRFDAIFVFQTSPVTAALPAVLIRGLQGAPLMLWVQDLWPDTLRAVGAVRSSAIVDMVGALVEFIYRRSDIILIQSRAFAEKVMSRAGPGALVEYLPNWADASMVSVGEVVRAPELAAYQSTFNIMFAGNLGEAQDLLGVVEAAGHCRDLEDLRWLIVGDGRARASIAAEITRRGLQDVVILLGRHPSARMPEFFAAADALLVSLKAEPIFAMTIPSKVQSYMATGRPVLGMLDGEGAAVIAEAGCGLAAGAGDSMGLAAKARELRALPAEARAKMGRAGKSYAMLHFDRDRLVDRVERWMEDLRRKAT